MRILHITNDYSGSTVYKNLIQQLDNLGVSQIVYNPIRASDRERIGKNAIELKTPGSEIIYAPILNYHTDRIFYKSKLQKIVHDLEPRINWNEIDLIHAHTWYSDGGVAYHLGKKYQLPYIVAIRSTDIDVFYKFLIHERGFGKQILDQSGKIILITAAFKRRVLSMSVLKPIKNKIESKLKIVPNGVDFFWIKNSVGSSVSTDTFVNILYVGSFIRRKHVYLLQRAVIKLSYLLDRPLKLHIVGSSGRDESRILKKVKEHPDLFVNHGRISDKEKLIEIYQMSDIFAMPSKQETFGLVYVEAMLQGLPILYTKNEGIDGFYDENIGEAVSSFDEREVMEKLKKMIDNISNYQLPTEKLKKNHNWKNIAMTYLDLYNSIINA